MLVDFVKRGKIVPDGTFTEAERLVNSTFTLDYEAEKTGNWHGDLEYVYHINLDDGVRLHCHKRNWNNEDHTHDNWRNWPNNWPKKTLFFADIREWRGKPVYNFQALHVED